MDNTSYIELDASAVHNNFEYIRNRLSPHTTFSHVIKGNAYGHGVEEFVPLAMRYGARHFSVFDSFEAYQLKKCLGDQPARILIMGMIFDEQIEWAIENNIEFYVFEMHRLKRALATARKMGKAALIHLELETGMNRTGLEKAYWPTAARLIKEYDDCLELMGFCTHYAGAESIANHIRIRRQIKRFKGGVNKFNDNGVAAHYHHTACSAAFMRFPQTHMDMVRIGIMQYGFWPSMETYIATEGASENPSDPLRRIISWKSRIMSTKRVSKGDYIGYGTSFLATRDMDIASVPVGYGHGFARNLSNSGRALVRGERVPVIGTVNMNMMVLDVSSLDNAETGDEVVLIGQQGEQRIDVSSFGDYSDQLNYELLTRLPKDIPRYVVNAS